MVSDPMTRFWAPAWAQFVLKLGRPGSDWWVNGISRFVKKVGIEPKPWAALKIVTLFW